MARKLRGLLVLFAALLVGCDHATKVAAHTVLQGRTVDLVPGVLDLRYAVRSLSRAKGFTAAVVLSKKSGRKRR